LKETHVEHREPSPGKPSPVSERISVGFVNLLLKEYIYIYLTIFELMLSTLKMDLSNKTSLSDVGSYRKHDGYVAVYEYLLDKQEGSQGSS
jgi:hypothetical protein